MKNITEATYFISRDSPYFFPFATLISLIVLSIIIKLWMKYR